MVKFQTVRGHTLIELACAFVVVSVLGVGLVHGGNNHARASTQAFRASVALTIAEAELERIRADPSAIEVGDIAWTILPDAGLPDARCARRTDIREPGVIQVEVEVAWAMEGSDQDCVVRLSSLFAREVAR